MKISNILVTGACGQIGSVLTEALRYKYGTNSVVASDITESIFTDGTFEHLDATDYSALEKIVQKYGISQIYHLAAILSAKGEENPVVTWDVNMGSLLNVLEVSRKHNIGKVFFPSSIAVFGEDAPSFNTPQNAPLNPSTMYGVNKVAAESLMQYYHKKYKTDIRSLRYPGIIGYQSLPGGGTTDYAVDIYHKAVNHQNFICFLKGDTTLPMIYMDDAIRATMEIMEADSSDIRVRSAYNLAGISFSPEEIAHSIKVVYPDFQIKYEPDFRQKIADSWPKTIDDSRARQDWGWKPNHNLMDMTEIMLEKLRIDTKMVL
ncbi:NAD-dependent epimerase/dehydratase family protein [Flagellimonas sp.]|uniref:NAD-dependent epimerase/dehydratase family protein n=1 Tax=Flagellimonas sp. TaxID=2058762 RepID=UPI003B507270